MLLFVLFGPVLTVTIIGQIVVRRLPGETRRHEREFFLASGMNMNIGSLDYTRPNQFRYRDVKLLDPITNKPILEVPELKLYEIQPGYVDQVFPESFSREEIENAEAILPGGSKNFWRAVIPKLRIDPEYFGFEESGKCLRELVLSILSKHRNGKPFGLRFEIDEFEIGTKNGVPLLLKEIHGHLSLKETQSRFYAEFYYLEFMEDKCVLSAKRMLDEEGECLSIHFSTRDRTIPCKVPAWIVPGFDILGENALFTGDLRALKTVNSDKWSMKFIDVFFNDGDMSRLASFGTEYALNGKIRGLSIKSATIIDGTLREADGFLDLVEGSIENRFLERLCDRFYLNADFRAVPRISSDPNRETPLDRFCAYYIFKDNKLYLESVAQYDKRKESEEANARGVPPNENLPPDGPVIYCNGMTRMWKLPYPPKVYPIEYVLSAIQSDETKMGPIDPKSRSIMRYLPAE